MKQCKNCDAYAEANGATMCRAEPPKVHVIAVPSMGLDGKPGMNIQTVAAWPTVSPNHWCRAYEPKLSVLA